MAVNLFLRHGFEACSVRDLAAAVGIEEPGIYSHFRSQEEMLSGAVLRTLRGFLEAVTALNTLRDSVTTWYRPSGQFGPTDVADQLWLLVCGALDLPDED